MTEPRYPPFTEKNCICFFAASKQKVKRCQKSVIHPSYNVFSGSQQALDGLVTLTLAEIHALWSEINETS